MLLLLAALAWRPRTPPELANYLSGQWHVRKEMFYARGGKDATFAGDAAFEALDDGQRHLLYKEDGIMTLADQRRLTASRRLIYDFEPVGDCPNRICIYFDEALSRDRGAVLRDARYFHDLWLPADPTASPPPFNHPCGPDVYTGTLSLESADTFVLDWRVDGPRKSGVQTFQYRRAVPGSEQLTSS